jgi:hypothetical protein
LNQADSAAVTCQGTRLCFRFRPSFARHPMLGRSWRSLACLSAITGIR